LLLVAQACLPQAGFSPCRLWRHNRAAMGAFRVTRSKEHRLKPPATKSK
jgi:hypothetical protein